MSCTGLTCSQAANLPNPHPQDCSPGYNTYSYSKSTSERLAYQLAGQQQHQQLTHTQQEQQQAGNGHGTVSHEGPRGGGAAAAAGGDTAAAGGGQGQQGPRWSLASVNPGVVFGPVRVAAHARSSPGMVKVRHKLQEVSRYPRRGWRVWSEVAAGHELRSYRIRL